MKRSGLQKDHFFYTNLGFTKSKSCSLSDDKGCFQIIPGTYESEKPIDITGIDNVHLKCVCINGSIVNGIREPILYSFALLPSPGQKIYKRYRILFFGKINKSVYLI